MNENFKFYPDDEVSLICILKKVVHVIHASTFRKFFGMLITCEQIGTTLFLIIHAHFTLGTVQSSLFENTTLNIHINIPHNWSEKLKYFKNQEL